MSEYDVQFSNETPKKANEIKKPLPEKQIRVVTKNPARTQKKSGVKKLTDAFIAEDLGSIKNYIVRDVLIPAVKKSIVDVVTNGIDLLFYGETGHSSRGRGGRMSYSSLYDGNRRRDDRRYDEPYYEKVPYDRQKVDTLNEAKEAIAQLNEIIDMYNEASIADYYEMIQKTAETTDFNYGWTEFITDDMVSFVRVPDGWVIKMPKAHPLKKR